MRYVTASEMQVIDKVAINDYHIPSIVLMENAGINVAWHAHDTVQPLKRVIILVGKGNNGGDGLVAARHLMNANVKVKIFLTADPEDLKGDAIRQYDIIMRFSGDVTTLRKSKDLKKLQRHKEPDLYIDSIFGTGFSGDCPTLHQAVIHHINQSDAPTLSVDIPSGLDATTGMVSNACVEATRTVTFGLPKKGFKINKGPGYIGKLFVENISFPSKLLK